MLIRVTACKKVLLISKGLGIYCKRKAQMFEGIILILVALVLHSLFL